MSYRMPHNHCNDNVRSRARYRGVDECGAMARYLSYIPTAQELIKKYCIHSFKHDSSNDDYTFLEYQICTILEWPENVPIQRTLKIDQIAMVLEQKKLRLHADPELPF